MNGDLRRERAVRSRFEGSGEQQAASETLVAPWIVTAQAAKTSVDSMENGNAVQSANTKLQSARQEVRLALSEARPELGQEELDRRSAIILEDAILLARCARSQCLVTYTDAVGLRGHGNPQNGQWLDDVFAYAIRPFGFPDLTMLVVNKATKQPSPDAFSARRTILSKVHVEDVPLEQRRCVWFQNYELVLGELSPIPSNRQLARLLTPEPEIEREISRAVGNAISRALGEGKESTSVGKAYPGSLSRAELSSLVRQLWTEQHRRCALTGLQFELRTDENGGIADDRMSLDRIDNSVGYTEGNIQLVTQFANRARGTLSVDEARMRLVQFKSGSATK